MIVISDMAGPRANEAGALYPPTVTAPPEPLPLWRFPLQFVRNPLRSLPVPVYREDKVVFSPRPGVVLIWVCGPQLVEQLLVRDADKLRKSVVERRVFEASLAGSVLVADGAAWRWQRRVLAPLFRPADLEMHVPAMVAAAQAQIARWAAAGPRVQAVDHDMLVATYDVIVSTMLVGGRPAEADAILGASEAYLAPISWEMAYGLLRLPPWLPHPGTWQMRRAARRLRAAVAAIIARRRAEGGAPADLLGRLLAARDPETGEPMPDPLLVSNLLTLLEAGHETTAKALTWALYLLARAPDWQDRIRAEVETVCGRAAITAADLPKLAMARRVIEETLRLYPSAPMVARETAEPIEIGGYAVPKDTQILVPIYAIHRHCALWEDPDRFDPDRFEPGAAAGRPRCQYMPFGAGPRVCIGATFAMMEATVLLASFVRAARFGWDGRHRPEPVSRITLRPAGGMPLVVSPLG